jgi:hypothetical protein
VLDGEHVGAESSLSQIVTLVSDSQRWREIQPADQVTVWVIPRQRGPT